MAFNRPLRTHLIVEAAFIGTIPTPQQSPTIPSASSSSFDRRSRRFENRSLESDEGVRHNQIVIEDYRCGFPIPQLPEQRSSNHLAFRKEVKTLEQYGGRLLFETRIRDILAAQNIDVTSITAHEYNEENVVSLPRLFLKAFAKRRHPRDQNWVVATYKVHNFFRKQQVDLEQWGFILEDVRAHNLRESKPILRGHPLAKNWKAICERLINEVLYPCTDWYSLDLVIRGRADGFPYDRDQPTIVLVVQPTSTVQWYCVAQSMGKLLKNIPGYDRIAVEVLRDVACDPAQDHIWPLPKNRLFSKKVVVGASAGTVSSNTETCTIAGMLCLEFGAEKRLFALTSFQIVAHIPADSQGISNIGSLKAKLRVERGTVQNALTPLATANYKSTLKIQMPSSQDYKLVVEDDEVTVARIIRAMKENWEAHDMLHDPSRVGRLERADREQYEQIEAILASAKARQSHPPPRKLGTLFAGSGDRQTAKRYLLDWALVDVERARLPRKNTIPIQFSTGPSGDVAQVLKNGPPLETQEVNDLVIQVYKHGRSTGLTTGFLNGVESTVLTGWHRDSNDKKVLKTSYTHLIIPPKIPGLDPSGQDKFAAPGDSGSAIFNVDGEFLGLYVGSGRDVRIPHHRFISNTVLFEDIKVVTGADTVRVATPSDLSESEAMEQVIDSLSSMSLSSPSH